MMGSENPVSGHFMLWHSGNYRKRWMAWWRVAATGAQHVR
jgi:hypothetical protein